MPALHKLNDEVETPLIDVLVEMEFNGIAIDPKILKEQSEVLGERAKSCAADHRGGGGGEFNPDSPKQLGDVLFNKLKLQVDQADQDRAEHRRRGAGEAGRSSTRCRKLILEYRSLVKLKNTYLDNLTDYVEPEDRADPRQLQPDRRGDRAAVDVATRTCRTSRSAPTKGRRIRLAFVPGDRGEERAADGGLQPDRAAAPGPFHAGAGAAAGVRGGRGHSPHRRRRGLRRPAGPGDQRAARAGQDDQLRHHLRRDALRPGAADRGADRQGGAGADQRRTTSGSRASSSFSKSA